MMNAIHLLKISIDKKLDEIDECTHISLIYVCIIAELFFNTRRSCTLQTKPRKGQKSSLRFKKRKNERRGETNRNSAMYRNLNPDLEIEMSHLLASAPRPPNTLGGKA